MTKSEPNRATTMKAIVQDEYGSADVLQYREIFRPTPADEQLLVHVRPLRRSGPGTGTRCRGDPYVLRLMARSLRKPRNPVRGLDMAGEVVAVGGERLALQGGRRSVRRVR